MSNHKILLIEDDPSLRGAIESFLKRSGYQVMAFSDVESALKVLDDSVELVVSDIKMKGASGFDLLQHMRAEFSRVPLILMTAYGTIEKAVEAMKRGAYDFLVKPFSLNVLETSINSAFLDRQSEAEMAGGTPPSGRETVSTPMGGVQRVNSRFITNHSRLKELIENVKRIAPSKATVLIQGESGTGKELIARMIHEFSPRANRIFVAINCAAMPDTLLESELFGHEKGAFTGAFARQMGKFELSHNGTILLDEISEMSLPMQTKLLRVLQESEIYRVGGVKPIPLNLRVIATTNRDLYRYMKEGHFREDLFYRLNVIPVMVPPLRERGDDIFLLTEEFLKEFSVLHGRKALQLDEAARKKIAARSWNGNVRELANAMERVVLVGDFDVLDDVGLPGTAADATLAGAPKKALPLAETERLAILSAVNQCGGNKTRAAQVLNISLRTLRNKLKQYGGQSKPPASAASHEPPQKKRPPERGRKKKKAK